MKNYIILLFFAIFSTKALFGEDMPYKECDIKLNFPPKKEALIIQAAEKVKEEIAPDIKTDTLVPVILSFYIIGKDPIVHKKMIAVHYMKDENDFLEFEEINTDPVTNRPNGTVTIRKKPNSILKVILLEDTLEPIFIMDNHGRGISFLPSYQEFRKKNPTLKLDMFTPQPGKYVVY